MDSSNGEVASAGGIEKSPTIAAVKDGHFAEPPRHDRILTLLPVCRSGGLEPHRRLRLISVSELR